MSKLNENPIWSPDIYKLTTGTPVLGADENSLVDDIGPSNIQAQQLADRTLYLKYSLDGLKLGENPYPSVPAAQAAINAGTIPLNAIFTVRGTTADSWVLEYQNINSKATPVLDENGQHRALPTYDFVNNVNQLALSLRNEATYRVKSVTYDADIYSGTCEIDGSLLFSDMRTINVIIPITNTSRSPTLTINEGASRAIRGPGGQEINPGELIGGTLYSLQWNTGASQWRIFSYPGDHAKVATGYQGVNSVSGTENAISVSIRGMVADSTALYFVATHSNTGPVTFSVTDIAGNTSTRTILKEGNSPLTGGEIAANNPVLMIYRGAPANNWVLIASGGVATSLGMRLNALEGAISSPLTSPTMENDIYSANLLSGSATPFNDNHIVTFRIPATNTTNSPSLSINNGASRAITAPNGSKVLAGDLVAGYTYQFSWQSGASQWRVMGYPADRIKYLTGPQKAIVTSNTSSPNAIALTIPGILGDGTELTFEPVIANTGAVVLTITDVAGNTQTRTLLKGANTPLIGGELRYANIAKVQWRAAPIANFKLVLAGDIAGDITALRNDISNLNGAIGDPLISLNKKMIEAPFGEITFKGGEKTVTKNQIICTSIGSSVGVGAGSSNGNIYAPNALFVTALKEQLKNYGEFEIINDNQCVPTKALQDFEVQLNNSPYATSDFLLIVPGMNDAPVGNFNMGHTFPRQKSTLERLIKLGQARGAIVIVCTSPHHNVEMPQTAPTIPGNNPLSWPIRTFNISGSYVFNAESNTISSGYFAAAGYGGDILKSGHTLRVDSGVNAGNYTISGISADRQTLTVVEDVPESSTYTTFVRHYNLSSIMEDVLYPPPSKSVTTKDWTGGGKEVAGDIRFAMFNNMARSTTRANNGYVLDAEWSGFRNGVEVAGWSAMYDVPKGNYNHMTDFGYSVSYGKAATAAAIELSSLVFMTKNFGRK